MDAIAETAFMASVAQGMRSLQYRNRLSVQFSMFYSSWQTTAIYKKGRFHNGKRKSVEDTEKRVTNDQKATVGTGQRVSPLLCSITLSLTFKCTLASKGCIGCRLGAETASSLILLCTLID